MSDRLVELEKKINKIRDSLEGAIKSLETRVSMLMKTLHSTNAEPVETYDFVWAMHQLTRGVPVKCLADGVIYAKRYSSCSARKDRIEFSSSIVNGAWTVAPGYEQSKTFNPLLHTGSFEWAMYQLKNGKCVRRRNWPQNCYRKLNGPVGFILDNDVDALDWEIYHEPHNIQWAAEQLQDDKIVKRRCWSTYRLYPHGNLIVKPEDMLADDWELEEDD